MRAERIALVCALLAVVLVAARCRTAALAVALGGLVGLLVLPSPPPPPHRRRRRRPQLTAEGYHGAPDPPQGDTKQRNSDMPSPPPTAYPPPLPVPWTAAAAHRSVPARSPSPPPPPADGRVTADHVGGGCEYVGGPCGRRVRPPPPCLPTTDECGHYVGEHTDPRARGSCAAPGPLASASQCRDRLTRIVPAAGRCGYRDTTGQMSRFAHLR